MVYRGMGVPDGGDEAMGGSGIAGEDHEHAVREFAVSVVNFLDIVGFLVLLAWGIALRRNPAAHRRMMILATISLADPGF
jgi:hypothetical protein